MQYQQSETVGEYDSMTDQWQQAQARVITKEGSDLLLCSSGSCLCLCQVLIRFKGGGLFLSSSICWLLSCPDDLCRLFPLFLLDFAEVQLLQLFASVYDIQPACMRYWFTNARNTKQASKVKNRQPRAGTKQPLLRYKAADLILKSALDALNSCLTRI